VRGFSGHIVPFGVRSAAHVVLRTQCPQISMRRKVGKASGSNRARQDGRGRGRCQTEKYAASERAPGQQMSGALHACHPSRHLSASRASQQPSVGRRAGVRLHVHIASDHRAVPDHHPWMDIAYHGVLAGCRRTLLEQQSPFPSRIPVLQIAPARSRSWAGHTANPATRRGVGLGTILCRAASGRPAGHRPAPGGQPGIWDITLHITLLLTASSLRRTFVSVFSV